MIFVILGTQDKQFHRLLKEVEELIQDGTIQEKVVVQAGTTYYQSDKMEIHKMIARDKFLNYIEQSDYVITHGGVGTILDAMKLHKKIIAVPRLKTYNEHENDHQLQIIGNFSKQNYIIGCNSVSDLKNAIGQIHTFEPATCQLDNSQMIHTIENYIEKTTCRRKDVMIYAFYAVIACIIQLLLYFLFQSTNMWLAWAIPYIPFIILNYSKRNHVFEITWAILLAFSLFLWFNLYQSLGMMMLLTIISYVITYIGHMMFYVRRVK